MIPATNEQSVVGDGRGSHHLLGERVLGQKFEFGGRCEFEFYPLKVFESHFESKFQIEDQYGPTHLFSDLSPRLNIAGNALLIEAAAAIALSRQLNWQAAQLSGAAASLRAAHRIAFSFPDERDLVTTMTSTLQTQLSAAQFSSAWESGWLLSPEQAVAEVLAVLLPSSL